MMTGPLIGKLSPVLFAATHSGALSNAQGAQLGAALGINATQWHETPPQTIHPILPTPMPTNGFVNTIHPIFGHPTTIHLPSALHAPHIEAPHPLVPTHLIVTGNPTMPLYKFNKNFF